MIPESTAAASYVNTTSPVTADFNGASVNGGAASSGSSTLFINGAALLVPIWNHYGLMLLLLAMMSLAAYQLRRRKS